MLFLSSTINFMAAENELLKQLVMAAFYVFHNSQAFLLASRSQPNENSLGRTMLFGIPKASLD